jgi:hypothetical protein
MRTFSDWLTSVHITYTGPQGRAIAQAVSRWLPTAAARVRTRFWQMGFLVDKVALGEFFLQVLRLPLPIFIPSNSS